MPPVTKAGGTQFRKDVEFVTTKDSDEYELEAVGIVMVPDKVDLQNDFAREETIRGFANQFETFVEAGEAGGGIMHAVFPDDWMDLTRNEVLEEAEEINGRTVDAGSWVQRWGITDAGLADLIDDGILAGYSIGAIQVAWNGPFDQNGDEVGDIDTSEIPDGELVWELVEGLIREVSAVDIPAVPDAQILEAKALQKRLGDHLGNRDAFIEEATQRGHSEDDAARLWDELNRAIEVEGSANPGDKSWFERAKDFFSGDGPGATADRSDFDPQGDAFKEGQTLSRKNRHSEMASIDASLDVLEDAGVDHGMTRFTDREEFDFDLSEHKARHWADPDEDEEEEEEADDKHAAEGDTSDDTDTTDMSDTDPMEDAPEWAQTLHDDIQENSKRLDNQGEQIEAALEATQEEKTAQIEINGEIFEVTESEAKAWFEDGQEPDNDPMADAPEYVRALSEKVDDVNDRINTINQQSGVSTQLERSAESEESDENGLDGLGKALS